MLSDRNRRKLIRIIKALRDKDPNFTVKRLVAHCRLLSLHISYRIFYREVKEAGFDYLPARKKGVLTSRDRMKERRLRNNARRFFPESPDSSGEILPSIQTGFLLFLRHSLLVTL